MTSNCPTNVGCGHYKSAASSLYSMHVHTGSFGLSVSFCGELGKPTGNATTTSRIYRRGLIQRVLVFKQLVP